MALEKSIDTEYGIPAIYWTISSIKIDRVNLCADIELSGFSTKESEESKAVPLARRYFHINFVENPSNTEIGLDIPDQAITPDQVQIFNTISSFGYALVRQSKDFIDSTNV
jgi:hypothetical protein